MWEIPSKEALPIQCLVASIVEMPAKSVNLIYKVLIYMNDDITSNNALGKPWSFHLGRSSLVLTKVPYLPEYTGMH